jgi:hypothetical protein
MNTIVESVIKWNGRILYGENKLGVPHMQSWLQTKADGTYKQYGQMAVILGDYDNIYKAKFCKNRTEAYNWLQDNFVSEGIIA